MFHVLLMCPLGLGTTRQCSASSLTEYQTPKCSAQCHHEEPFAQMQFEISSCAVTCELVRRIQIGGKPFEFLRKEHALSQ